MCPGVGSPLVGQLPKLTLEAPDQVVLSKMLAPMPTGSPPAAW